MKDQDDVEAESLLSTGGNQDHQKQISHQMGVSALLWRFPSCPVRVH